MKKLILTLFSLCSFIAHAELDGTENIYAKLLASDNLSEVKLGAKSLHHDLPVNIELWDIAGYTLWLMDKAGDKTDKEYEDTFSWLAKAIGESNNSRYRQLLSEQLDTAQSKKIKRYLKGAINSLESKEVPQFQAANYTLDPNATQTHSSKAMASTFEQIKTGDNLKVVLSMLGQPDGVGQYVRSYSRPFIGRQTFQNLRLSYINVGSMELRYEKTHWVVKLKSVQTDADIANVHAEYRDLLSRLVSNDVTQIRAAAREAIQLPLTDPATLDHIAQYIWDNQNTQDGHLADSLAWLCKVLSKSQDGRFKEMLQTLAQKPLHKKITRYAASSAKNLTSNLPYFTPKILASSDEVSKTNSL